MRKGHGKLQRRLLQLLHEHEHTADSLSTLAAGFDTVTLAARAYYGSRWMTPESRELVATRRALAGLMQRGVVVRISASRTSRRVCWRLNVAR